MAINPTNVFTQTRVDRSGETARWSVSVAEAEVIDPVSAELGAVITAVQAVINGDIRSQSVSINRKVSNSAAASDNSQREEKWLVQYEDTVTHALYHAELPCRDTTIQPPIGTDEVDLNVAPWVAFKTAWENGAILSPDGNAITLRSVRLIGRNI